MLSVGLGDSKMLLGSGHCTGSQQCPEDRMGIWRALQGLKAGFETLKLALH